MHFSSKTSLFLVTAAAVAFSGLAACGGGEAEAPLINTTINIQSITQEGNCEDVNVKVTPVSILPGAPKMSNNKEFVTPIKLTKGADGVSCTGGAAKPTAAASAGSVGRSGAPAMPSATSRTARCATGLSR